MSDRIICPICPEGEPCDHDQDDRRALCKHKNVEETPEPQVYIASDPDQVGAKKSRENREVAQADLDLKWIMQQPQGRRFVWAQLARCHIYRTSYTSNAVEMALLEGERNIGLKLSADLMRAARLEYLMMLKDHDDHA